jgi:hypothetical protein
MLYLILKPIIDVQEDGINILCGDGKRRLCFPRLCQYIADYEELRLLAGILSGYCPKCTIPAFNHKEPEHNVLAERENYPLRDSDEAHRLRTLLNKEPALLKLRGYHLVTPFSENPIISKCSIYDAAASDLLHQVSKDFYDQIHRLCLAALEIETGKSLDAIMAELDARFTMIPMYAQLRWFNNGITHIQRWTGGEYKEMLRVYLGVMRGMGSDDVLRLIKAHLDCHRMAHYESHTDSEGREGGVQGTVQLLQRAVDVFWDELMNPEGVFRKHNIVKEGWYTMKLHQMRHYVENIRQKGSLPQCSTDKTEALHRHIKGFYNDSSKGPNVEEQIVKKEARGTSFRAFQTELEQLGLSGPPLLRHQRLIEDEEEEGHENDSDEGERPVAVNL